MKTTMKRIACLFLIAGLVSGCSMNKDKKTDEMGTANKSADKAKDDAKKTVDGTKDAMDAMDDNIDNMMTYFKDQGVAYEDMKTIDNMDFAAHEGRSFMNNGQMTYLYRVKSDDENMKKVIKEANDNGKVKVKIDNKEQEYGAKVNGDYLLLYNMDADMGDMMNVFPSYQPGSSTNPSGMNEEMNGNTVE